MNANNSLISTPIISFHFAKSTWDHVYLWGLIRIDPTTMAVLKSFLHLIKLFFTDSDCFLCYCKSWHGALCAWFSKLPRNVFLVLLHCTTYSVVQCTIPNVQCAASFNPQRGFYRLSFQWPGPTLIFDSSSLSARPPPEPPVIFPFTWKRHHTMIIIVDTMSLISYQVQIIRKILLARSQ